MSEKQIPCPYCGKMIDISIEQCPHCGEHFKEITIPLKIDSLGKFIVFNILTLGLYQYFWLIFNLKNISSMIIKEKDKYKLNIPIIALAIVGLLSSINLVCFDIFKAIDVPDWVVLPHLFFGLVISPICIIAGLALTYIITYRILRIIERYTKYKYDIEITHSEMGWLFCPVFFVPMFSPMFYTIYFIYTYKERVYNPKPITI